jgi:hypothetical protein
MVEVPTDQGEGNYTFTITDSYGDGFGNNDKPSDDDEVGYYEITLDGKVIHRSADNASFNSEDVTITITDRDGDGFNDISDPDEDGDGVVDTDEMNNTGSAVTDTWTETNTIVTASANTTDIEAYSVPTAGVSDWNYDTTNTFNSNNGAYLWSRSGLTGHDRLTIKYGEDAEVATGDTRKMTIHFSEPQTHAVVHYDRVGGYSSNGAISVEMTLTSPGVTMQRLSGNDQFIADSSTKKIYRDVSIDCNQSESDTASNYTAGGSVEFNSTVPFTQLTFDVDFISANSGDRYGDYFDIIVEADTYVALDTDGDGINDVVDLDSDNDGIPDNVETQTTGGFALATGTDSDGDGIDDAYDPDNGGTPTSLIDTDGDGTPDIYDLDSDGDGINDCEEGIPGGSCPVDNADVGANGLVDWAENSDDWSEPAGVVTDPLLDLKDEESTNGEAAYRELGTDTDGDGISDYYDYDDDNDGILDAIEFQGITPCVNGLFQTKNDSLYILDVIRKIYVQIGITDAARKVNALAFDDTDGKLYAVFKGASAYTDAEGRTIDDKDIVTVSRIDGDIHWYADNTHASIAGDIENGKFYFLLQDSDKKTIKVFDIASKTFDADVALSDAMVPNDFAVYNGKAYGVEGNYNDSNYSDQKLYIANLSNGSVSTADLVLDGAGGDSDGAAFIAKDSNGDNKLYISNNDSGTFRIDDFDGASPTAVRVADTGTANGNDGASCHNAMIKAADTDGDGFPDYLDLDSDNDGIPDNIEAQGTGDFNLTAAGDADGDGLADIYDNNDSGVFDSRGLIPKDTDRDGIPDYLDSDSDNDGYTDCEEGMSNALANSRSCPVDGTDVGGNGLVSWAEDDDTYGTPNGKITDPDPTQTGDMEDEYSANNDNEAAYREFLCGKALTQVTAYNWRLISIPCDTGTLTIDEVFGPSLGTYGDNANYVIYKQSGEDDYEVDDAYGDTDKAIMSAGDTLDQGKSYWIITDANHTITIDKTLSGLAPTPTTLASASDIDINDPDAAFREVFDYGLFANSADYMKKYMAGNPFPYKFDVARIYTKQGNGDYTPLSDSANADYVSPLIYTHDSPDITGEDIADGGGYRVLDASTPGFDDKVAPMEGFFMIFPKNNSGATNNFAFPLMTQYGN